MHPVLTDRGAPQSDGALLARARDGDRDAFRLIYERHVGAVLGYIAGRVGPDAAQDLASETFVEAWSARHRFDLRRQSVRPWLYGIATNVVGRHREREARWLDSIEHLAAGGVSEPTATDVEVDIDLQRALRRLTPALRDVLLLTAIADLRVADAARALGISTTAARVRLHRARAIVSAALEECRDA